MHRNPRAALLKVIHFGAAAGLLGGCYVAHAGPAGARRPGAAVTAPARPDPAAPRLAALETRHFELAQGQELVGETQVIFARYENTFSAIGRQYNLGYEEMRRANPGVDQWLPGEGTPIYLPTQTILPEAPRTGIVVNVPAMRLYYFTTEKGPTEKAAAQGGTDDPQGLHAPDRHRRRRVGRRHSAKRRSRRRRAIRSGTCRRRSARSMPSAAIRCRASCSPAPTIRSAPMR